MRNKEGTEITPELISTVVGVSREDPPDPTAGERWKERLADCERDIIGKALQRNEGNQSEAAKTLGMSRQWLRIKMKRLGIGIGEIR